MKYKLQLFLLFWATIFALKAQENFAVKSLSIFKNGQSFVVKEGQIDAINKTEKIDNLPNALFGTYWFVSDSKSIVSVVSKMERVEAKEEKKANNILDLLYANKGKNITVHMLDNESYSGVIEDFDRPNEVDNKEYNPIIILKAANKWVSLKPTNIESIEFSDKPNRTTTTNAFVEKPVITIQFKEKGKQQIRIMYLQEGLSWTPVYKLESINDQQGRLSLQAEVKNQTEDIQNVDVDFVVGVPNFSSANTPATLLNINGSLPSLYKQGNLSNTSQLFSNAIISSGSSKSFTNEIKLRKNEDNVSTSENEDLYFYTVKKMNLPKGSSANFPILEENVSLKHIYMCDLPESSFKEYRIKDLQDDDAITSQEEQSLVDHYIEIKNQTESPLTSGPILILNDSQKALAQSILYFTAKGNNSQIFITNSPDIHVKDKEEVIETKLNDKNMDGYNYALLTIRGTISVNNTKSKNIEINLTKSIVGKISSSSIKYNVSVDNTKKSQKLSFSSTVKANSEQIIEYTYQMYSRQYN